MTNQLQPEIIPISDLELDPNNARVHSDENLTAITSSLSRFGQIKPIVVTPDNRVIAGNGTLEAAKNLGWKKITIVRTPPEWSESQAMAYAIADNRTAELAEWNADTLASQLLDLDAVGWDIQDLGFPSLQPPTEEIDDWGKMKPVTDDLIRCPKCGHAWIKGDMK